LFSGAAHDEAALEVAEGVPEYTGVKLGLSTPQERTQYALRDLSAFVDAPTFVRSFAYALGPAYGLLLDQFDPGWRRKLNSGKRLDELLQSAMSLAIPADLDIKERAARYDKGELRAAEERREEQRKAQLAAYRSRLVDGPVVELPLGGSTVFQFNPQTLVPLDGEGTIYPTVRLTDEWGALEVDEGGALVKTGKNVATVSAAHISASSLSGEGWRLTLKPGWTLRPEKRAGNFIVAKETSHPS
jgi:hypothetical protein